MTIAESAASGSATAFKEDALQPSLQDLSQLVMSPSRLDETLRHIADFAVRAIPGAEGAGLTLFQDNRPDTVVASAPFVRDADSLQYLLGEGPCINATREAQAVRSGGMDVDPRFPNFGPAVAKLGLQSMLSLPLLDEDTVLGSINLYSHQPEAFDERAEALGLLFTRPAAISVRNAQALSQAIRLAKWLQAELTQRLELEVDSGHPDAASAAEPDTAGAELRIARRQAHLAVAAQENMTSRMSHELRTPLNEVLGFAQLLQLEALTPDQHNSVEHILSGGRHLLAMVDDVLDLNSARADQLPLLLEEVQISDVIADAVAAVASAAEAADIAITVGSSIAGPAHHPVYADRQRLYQILRNLLSNAAKYTQHGGWVHILSVAPDAEHVAITVADNGPGIPAADLHRVFTPFDRLDQTSRNPGVGIGLAISQRLAIQMSGILEVSSAPGTGTAFTITLPTSRTRPGPAQDPARSQAAVPPESEHNL